MRTADAAQPQPQTVLQWIRPPRQARTRDGLNRLLDAAEVLVAEKGFDGTGIAEIARRAGASVGGFYRRFPDKGALLHALHERFCEEARATAAVALDPARWTGAPTAEILGQFAAFLVQIYREREGFFRAFLLRGSSDPTVRARTDQLVRHLADRLAALLRGRRAEIAHPDPRLAATFGLHVVIGTLNHTVQSQPTGLRLSDDRITGELTRLFVAYLGGAPIQKMKQRRSCR
jgi:AcrR family transcriptional regulator